MHPTYIRTTFLEHLEQYHAALNYTRNREILARALGATVQITDRASFLTTDLKGRPLIVVQTHSSLTSDCVQELPPGRVLFNTMHEIAHLALLTFEDGQLARALKERYGRHPFEHRRRVELLCNLAASRLAMPDVLLEPTLKVHGYTPRAVFELARVSGASHSAALRRIIRSGLLEVWGVLLRVIKGAHGGPAGEWRDSVYQGPNSHYLDVRGLPIPDRHPLLSSEEGDSLPDLHLEHYAAPYMDARPFLFARFGNKKVWRVCAFLFPDEDARALALACSGGIVSDDYFVKATYSSRPASRKAR